VIVVIEMDEDLERMVKDVMGALAVGPKKQAAPDGGLYMRGR
jgi:hypothetical protein